MRRPPRGLFAALGAARIVPGHGAVGGPELIASQATYHAEVARLVRGAPGGAETRTAIRARLPGLLLEGAVESAILAHAAGAH